MLHLDLFFPVASFSVWTLPTLSSRSPSKYPLPPPSLRRLTGLFPLITIRLTPGNWAQPPPSWQHATTAQHNLHPLHPFQLHIFYHLYVIWGYCQLPRSLLTTLHVLWCMQHTSYALWLSPAHVPCFLMFPERMQAVWCLWQHLTHQLSKPTECQHKFNPQIPVSQAALVIFTFLAACLLLQNDCMQDSSK